MVILGINAYHADSAACLLRDGELVAAAEEERFRRIKHWAGLPTRAIGYCLDEAGVSPEQVDIVAINSKPRANLSRRTLFVLRHRPAVRLVWAKLRNVFAARSIAGQLRTAFPAARFHARLACVEHHHAHLASAYFTSGFDEAACVSVDGCGDFASTVWGVGQGEIKIHERILFPHSLGIFYSAITQWLGFHSFGDEYKVMGLAAYGQPRFLNLLRQVLQLESNGRFKLELAFFRHHTQNVSYEWNDRAPEVGTLYTPSLEVLLGASRQKGEPLEQRHKDIAASAQALYEQALFSLLNAVHRRHPSPNLALAGGCALNSLANGKIQSQTRFRNVYIPPAPGDAGGAIGAALVVWHELRNQRPKPSRLFGANAAFDRTLSPADSAATRVAPRVASIRIHAYAGPHFGDSAIASALRRHDLRESFFPFSVRDEGQLAVRRIDDPEQPCIQAARAIAAGQVVGWFQGRMEWGPRALGNRSILCDPRRADMKEILNAKIKRRESFRPFAPAILRDKVADWFEQEADVPFMSCTFQVRHEKRALIPAVTHVDGSARLQTVARSTNPLFHRLISDFFSLTSVPLVLNTSFNEQEPIVCRPEEALDCFLRTEMDVLVLGNFFITRAGAGQPQDWLRLCWTEKPSSRQAAETPR